MEYLTGLVLAIALCAAASLVGFDRERAFYPTMLIVVASYYVLFAVMAGDRHALLLDMLAAGAFLAAAIVGFKTSLWVVVAGLAAHGLLDFLHHRLLRNAGVPGWWPGFCLVFDVAAALFLAGLLRKRTRQAAGS